MKHSFIVTIDVSNKDAENVRKKLETKLADWLDNVSFLTDKKETVINVTLINEVEPGHKAWI